MLGTMYHISHRMFLSLALEQETSLELIVPGPLRTLQTLTTRMRESKSANNAKLLLRHIMQIRIRLAKIEKKSEV